MALDQSNSPPIGEKMMPTMKKRGRTVLGVRMGLQSSVDCHAIEVSMELTAMLSVFADETQYL